MGLHAIAAVIALRAGELSCVRGMVCPECLAEFRQEYVMALRADIRHVFEIIAADHHSIRDGNGKIGNGRPPDAGEDTQNDRAPLQNADRDG